MQCIFEGGVYSHLSVYGVAFIRGQRLFEARSLLEEIWYLRHRSNLNHVVNVFWSCHVDSLPILLGYMTTQNN